MKSKTGEPIAEFTWDGDPLWIYTVEEKVDWNEVAFRRGFVQCPECYDEGLMEGEGCNDVSSIFPQRDVGPDEYGLHWCPCGCIWLCAYGENHTLISSRDHTQLRAMADLGGWQDEPAERKVAHHPQGVGFPFS